MGIYVTIFKIVNFCFIELSGLASTGNRKVYFIPYSTNIPDFSYYFSVLKIISSYFSGAPSLAFSIQHSAPRGNIVSNVEQFSLFCLSL
jgi:hypothetical protein